MSKTNSSPAKRTGKTTTDVPARTGSKLDLLLALLHRPDGVSLAAMCAATGWQTHSVRGALSGHIKRKLGLNVTSAKVDGTRLYRIAPGEGA